jgi:hypothetical protein
MHFIRLIPDTIVKNQILNKMETDFEATLKRLNEQVSQFTKTHHKSQTSTSFAMFKTPSFSKLDLSSPIVKYTSLPLLILILLAVIQPAFVKEEIIGKDGNKVKKLSISRLLFSVVLITIAIGFLCLLMMYKKFNLM